MVMYGHHGAPAKRPEETFGPSSWPAGEPGDSAVKSPRHRGTARPGPPLENAAQKAKDAPS